jgi:hypothetical protein
MDDFEMPPIEVGRSALYYIDGDRSSRPSAAIIIGAGDAHVTVISFPDWTTGTLHDGVMHIDDPRVKNQYNDAGAWDYTEFDKKLLSIVEKRGPGRPRKEAQPVL